MKNKLLTPFLILFTTVLAQAQSLDSLRQIVKSMNFDTPVLSPIPVSVTGAKVPSISLNGTWKFNPDNKDLNTAKNIEVPGEWEMQGYKVRKGSSATYWKTFIIPTDWEGNRVKIRFDGVSSYGLIKINGKSIGSHEGSFAAFEFDITDAVKPGENVLEVEVQCETISDILACTSQYAAHPVGGILRKVTLYILPAISISDFAWHIRFDKDYRDAAFNFTGRIDSRSRKKSKIQIRLDLNDASGKPVALKMNTFEIPYGRGGSAEYTGSVMVPSPEKWDPEHPYLYTLTTTLITDGKVLQTDIQKIGFRQIELRGNRFFVNNHPVKLRGVNRHEIHPLRGRSLTPDLCRSDAELFRAGNCNYIRTSHYPPSEEFLQACDELGLFVESEASLCWIQHGASPIWETWNYLDTMFLQYMIRANFDNVLAGRQHPCIVIWSLGNESRWSPLWERVNAEVKKLDPSRPTAFHDQCWTTYNNAGSKADIANYHYPGFSGPRECEKEKTRPTLFGEYMHVQCYARREVETDPSVRSDVYANTLKQMVDSVYTYPACMGGAIWSGIDDIFHLSENRICGYGPWGPVDGWRREKPEYTGMKKSYAPVIITNIDGIKTLSGKIVMNIENRYNFTNINELKITAKSGNVTLPLRADIPPLGNGSLTIELPAGHQAEKLLVTFTDPRGFICQEEAIESGIAPGQEKPQVNIDLSFTEDNKNYTIASGKNIFSVDKKTGIISCTLSGEKGIITGGELMLVPFNNDDGGAPNIANNGYTQDIQPLDYEPVDNFETGSVIAWRHSDGTIRLTVSGTVTDKLEGKHEYLFTSGGDIEVSYDYVTLTDFMGKDRLRQYGILFTLPVTFDRLSWKRKGLWTVYPDYDINRLDGFAKANPRDMKYVEAPREIPDGLWKESANKLGTNDFRSTKDNILRASLSNENSNEIMVKSDGSQSARAWVDGEKIRFLVAGLNGPGSCGFFTGPRPEFTKGDHLTGKFVLCIQ